ncbi:MAG: hypothetical protein NVS3B12_20300 [Acidimicrobiales bacterium]
MIFVFFAALVAAQLIGLLGLRRRDHEVGFSALVAAMAGVAAVCGELAVSRSLA